jgi:cell envelope opacity-associated protein A
MQRVSKQVRNELVEALRERYEVAAKTEKSRILKEFTAVSCYHRKHAIRLLKVRMPMAARAAIVGRRVYNEALRQALVVLWESADRICGKRLKALIPSLLPAMERHGHMKLEATVREQLLQVSAATIDRLLNPVRRSAGSRRKKKPVKRLARRSQPRPRTTGTIRFQDTWRSTSLFMEEAPCPVSFSIVW